MTANSIRRRFVSGLTAVTLGVCLGGCAVAPAQATLMPPEVALVAPLPPPPPRVEVIPVAPGPEFFWVYGHWTWVGHEHRWEDGHWERHREHEYWVPHRWERDERGQWRLHEGYWRRN